MGILDKFAQLFGGNGTKERGPTPDSLKKLKVGDVRSLEQLHNALEQAKGDGAQNIMKNAPALMEAILPFTESNEEKTLWLAVSSVFILGETYGDEASVLAYLGFLSSPSSKKREAALETVSGAGDAFEYLSDKLDSENPKVRMLAAEGFKGVCESSDIHESEAIEIISDRLEQEEDVAVKNTLKKVLKALEGK